MSTTRPLSGINDQELRDYQANKLALEIRELEGRELWSHRPIVKAFRWTVRNNAFLLMLVAVTGIAISIVQYSRTTERDFKKPFWEKQLNLYMDLTGAAAILTAFATDQDPVAKAEYQKARVKFWELYYGQLAVIADPEVDKIMVDFGQCLRQIESNDQRCDTTMLKQKSLSLAAACRSSVSTSWKQNLGEATAVR